MTADDYAKRYMELRDRPPAPRVLDLGCGTGDSVDLFRSLDPAVAWTGVDIERSPEVESRTRDDATFVTFDGVHLPFEDAGFDLVYCKQVLEHVRHPEPLLAEVARVLPTGGWFAGSTSHLEVLSTDHARALYRKRQTTIEPVFGQMKFNRGFDRFGRRGRSACRSEWRLFGASHNLLKLHSHRIVAAAA